MKIQIFLPYISILFATLICVCACTEDAIYETTELEVVVTIEDEVDSHLLTVISEDVEGNKTLPFIGGETVKNAGNINIDGSTYEIAI